MGKMLAVRYVLMVSLLPFAALVSAQQPYETHNIGNVNFTVTYYGACGFLSSQQLEGEGFKYPLNGANHLFYGGIAAGNSPDYLCDRYFGVGAPGPDNTDWNNVDGLYFGGAVYSDQDGWAQYDDSGHPLAEGIVVTQHSWAWAAGPYNDFVILRYTLLNAGQRAVNQLYAGQFMDFDVIDGYSNYSGTDAGRRLAYMWYTAAFPYCGIKLLDPTTAANLSVIDHLIWVYPDSMMSDGAKHRFLDGTLSQVSGAVSQDWSVVVSAGPFTLPPGDSAVVAIAVLAGDNLADLQENADRAQEKYDFLGIEEAGNIGRPVYEFQLSQNYPNPLRHMTTIRYALAGSGHTTLSIYDLTGRAVTTLVDRRQEPGLYSVPWDGRDGLERSVPNGVYFYRLSTRRDDGGRGEAFTSTRKLTVLR